MTSQTLLCSCEWRLALSSNEDTRLKEMRRSTVVLREASGDRCCAGKVSCHWNWNWNGTKSCSNFWKWEEESPAGLFRHSKPKKWHKWLGHEAKTTHIIYKRNIPNRLIRKIQHKHKMSFWPLETSLARSHNGCQCQFYGNGDERVVHRRISIGGAERGDPRLRQAQSNITGMNFEAGAEARRWRLWRQE